MPYILVRHTVEDFATWKPIFDEHASERSAAGCQGGQLMRSAENPNDVTVLFKWDSLENAQSFSQSPSLHEAMQRGGVTSAPSVTFFDDAESVSV